MKSFVLLPPLLLTCVLSHAQEIGQVTSRTAIYRTVAVPRQICGLSNPTTASPSGAGAVSGALTGAMLGSMVSDGRGAGALLGTLGGAIVGDQSERSAYAQPVTTCTTQTTLENRLVGFDVTYEYAGKSYTVQLPQDPGPTLPLQISPAGVQNLPALSNTLPANAIPAPSTAVGTVQAPTVVYVSPPAPVYYSAPSYYPRYLNTWPTTSVQLGWGWHSGAIRHHRHWR